MWRFGWPPGAWTCEIKKTAFVYVGQCRLRDNPPWNSVRPEPFSKFMIGLANRSQPFDEVIDFLNSSGFCKKWIPESVSGLDFLWGLTAEDFLLGGVSHCLA